MNNRAALNIEYVAHMGDIVNVATQITSGTTLTPP